MSAVLAATSVIRRLLLTPARAGISLLLGGLMVFAATAANLSGEADNVVADLVPGGLLLVVVPLVSLIFAVGAVGDLVDDGTLVYLWLKPLPRWQLAVASVLATWQFVVPVAVLSAAGVAVLGGQADLLVPAVLACTLGAMAYSALFVGLGLRTTRSLLAGLVGILLWEGFFAGISGAIATWSVRRWTSALFEDLGGRGVESPLASAGALHAAVVLLLVSAAGAALTARWLGTRDVP